MLSAALPMLQQNILKILKDAYMTQFSANGEAGSYSASLQLEMEKKAMEFATKAAQPTAQAIHDFVKEIGITTTVSGTIVAPPMPPTLPGGPCTGVINMTDVNIL